VICRAVPLSSLAPTGLGAWGSLSPSPRLVLRWSPSRRTVPALAELTVTSANIRTEVADAADATVAWSLLDQYEPEVSHPWLPAPTL
jgi:hypothetical protein